MSPPPFSRRVEPAGSPDSVDRIYFGSGCFWHMQYEFVSLEQDGTGAFGGRDDAHLSSLAGYAGGKWESPQGSVCYHGMPHADYGRLGHAEAVSIRLDAPNATGQVSALAAAYFDGFRTVGCSPAEPQCADGSRRERVDHVNAGAEYRNVIGFVGGMDNAATMALIVAANTYGMQLVRGGEAEADTESEYVVYVYDSTARPFFAAEPYHQLHPDLTLAPAMPTSYTRALRDVLEKLGRFEHGSARGCLSFPGEYIAWVWPLMAGLPFGTGLGMLLMLAKELRCDVAVTGTAHV
jgi:peptide methionine sulfoxide reductase MsrA